VRAAASATELRDDVSESDSSPSSAHKAEAGTEAFYAEIDAYFENAAPLWKQLVVPFAALVLGLPFVRSVGVANTVGKVCIFFGAQTFMNLYMKVVLSGSLVSRELHLKGYPAAFAVTAIQQVASFVIILLGIAILWCSPWRYTPVIIDTKFGLLTVLAFSVTFTLNISLNNFSLSLLPLSVNLIMRSCSPLSTFLCEIAMDKVSGRNVNGINMVEVSTMLLGIVCAGLAVVGKSQSSRASADPEAGSNVVLGVLVCLASLASASLNMALVGLMGTSLKMNPIDTALYMAPPSALMLLVPIFFMPHPTEWPGAMLTDWQITKTVAERAPDVLGLAFLSGGFAVAYNVLTYFFVQSLSATHAAFASNFNKAATIGIAVMVGLETLNLRGWGLVMAAGITGNIAAFTAYSVIKASGSSALKK
jgi:drug/metabolite transporter (DMT)-like permease